MYNVEFTPRATCQTTNFGGVEIEICRSNDGLRYCDHRGQGGNEIPVEVEIETFYHEDTDQVEPGESEQGFETPNGVIYLLCNFIRV